MNLQAELRDREQEFFYRVYQRVDEILREMGFSEDRPEEVNRRVREKRHRDVPGAVTWYVDGEPVAEIVWNIPEHRWVFQELRGTEE